MEKKPNLFVNKIEKNFDNNDRIFYSCSDSDYDVKKILLEKEIKRKSNNLNKKINSIFTSSNYVYKAEVIIKFKDKEAVKKIIGKNQKYLITIDNELIPISEIIDIYFSD